MCVPELLLIRLQLNYCILCSDLIFSPVMTLIPERYAVTTAANESATAVFDSQF